MLTGDVNGDGVVNDVDLTTLRSAFGQVGANLPSDVNSDGVVDLADFQIVVDNQGLTVSPLATSGSAAISIPGGAKQFAPVSSLQIEFSKATSTFPLAGVSLDVANDDRGDVLTAAQTPSRKLGAGGTWDGKTWVIPNLEAVTLIPGNYLLTIEGVRANDGAVMAKSTAVFQRTSVIPNSDLFMRSILNASELHWDYNNYAALDTTHGAAIMSLGTYIHYGASTSSLYDASGSPLTGLSGIAGRENASTAYDRLYAQYKLDHPTTVVAQGSGLRSVQTVAEMNTAGRWPSPNLWVGSVPSSVIGAGVPTSPFAGSAVDISRPGAVDALFAAHRAAALGLNGRPRTDMYHLDEVGYTYANWDATVELLTRLKTELTKNGVLLSINVGGWSWTDPFFFGENVISELPRIADSVEIESIWSRNQTSGVEQRSAQNTRKLIANIRSVMDAGTAITLLPTAHDWNANAHKILKIEEVETAPLIVNNNNPLGETTTTALRITTSSAHHIFPTGGAPFERFELTGLPAKYASLPTSGWTAIEVPGHPDQVDVYNRYTRLEDVKSSSGVAGKVSYNATTDGAGAELHDNQASSRMYAALALLARRPGDSISVFYSPGQLAPGGGDPNDPENWFYWSKNFGDPVSDYVIDSVNPSTTLVRKMHRDFENATLEVFPEEGFVNVIWRDNPGTSIPPVVVNPPVVDTEEPETPQTPTTPGRPGTPTPSTDGSGQETPTQTPPTTPDTPTDPRDEPSTDGDGNGDVRSGGITRLIYDGFGWF